MIFGLIINVVYLAIFAIISLLPAAIVDWSQVHTSFKIIGSALTIWSPIFPSMSASITSIFYYTTLLVFAGMFWKIIKFVINILRGSGA